MKSKLIEDLRSLRGKGITFSNLFPIPLLLYTKNGLTGKISPLGPISPKESRAYPTLRKGDIIVLYRTDGKLLSPPYEIPFAYNNFALGAISFDDNGPNNLRDLTSDIPEIMVTNHTSLSMDFYYNGNKTAVICAANVVNQDDEPLKAGGCSQIAFDNFRYGLCIGKKIGFGLSDIGKDPFVSGTISDKWMRNVHIGLVQPISVTSYGHRPM